MTRLCALLLCGLVALLAPAVASAETYEVDSVADDGDAVPGAPCDTGLGVCTLRAAIQVSNGTVGTPDEIVFKLDPFNGQLADTINLVAPLPPITGSVVIDGAANGLCLTAAAVNGPCGGVHGQTGFFVQSDEVAIEGLAITGADFGIEVHKSQTFTARGNWVGIDLAGETKPTGTGIVVGPGSDFALIGGPGSSERNVIAGAASVGLDLEGASNAEVVGNYFGVGPDGATVVPQPTDIQITDSTVPPGFPAVGNVVGVTVGPVGEATAPCDFGCNVIAGANATGIDLTGVGAAEDPATGPTTIHGNFIGLRANGTEAIGAGIGIEAGSAGELTIGGPTERDSNFFGGGALAVIADAAPDLVIEGNAVGYNSLENGGVTPPGGAGFVAVSTGLSAAASARIAGNAVRLEPGAGVGIAQEGVGADIVDNTVSGGLFGIRTTGNTVSQGNLVDGNTVSKATLAGIEIANSENEVRGNHVFDVAGPGIRVLALAVEVGGNLVGGNVPGTENTISGNEGPAIAIETAAASQNEVGRNRGEGNVGAFIDLVPLPGEPNGPNGGIQPPAFANALQSTATGTALPGARVRVFRKTGAEPGELESFLGEAVADAGGNWKVAYPSQLPVGTIVAATQTNALGGTSELATAKSAPDPLRPVSVCAPLPCPPQPRIYIKGPKRKSFSTTAKFKFSANVPGLRFQCKLDKGKFSKCRSPKVYRNLKPGKHVFRVRGLDAEGHVDLVARRKFTVLTK